MKKVLQKKFDVTEVDEFKTSKTCNLCFGEMSGYVKRDGRRSCDIFQLQLFYEN